MTEHRSYLFSYIGVRQPAQTKSTAGDAEGGGKWCKREGSCQEGEIDNISQVNLYQLLSYCCCCYQCLLLSSSDGRVLLSYSLLRMGTVLVLQLIKDGYNYSLLSSPPFHSKLSMPTGWSLL